MKEPIVEEIFSEDFPICPWCETRHDEEIDPTQENYVITCNKCHEEFTVYPVVTCVTYPIESKEN